MTIDIGNVGDVSTDATDGGAFDDALKQEGKTIEVMMIPKCFTLSTTP